MQRAVLIALMLMLGCQQIPQQTYIEGTSLTLGLYIPMNGTVYGIQAVNYLSGKKTSITTNETLKVESNTTLTNSSFGVFSISENSNVKVGK